MAPCVCLHRWRHSAWPLYGLSVLSTPELLRRYTVSIKQALFRVGLVIYVLSFFLVATGDPKGWVGRMRGYECAYSVVRAALTTTPFSPNSDDYAPPLLYVSILASALINPTFLVHVVLSSRSAFPLSRAMRA